MSITVVSSPGKVLIAGGYLVLDQKFTGLVISASSRFYAVIHIASNRVKQARSSFDRLSLSGPNGHIRSPSMMTVRWT